MKTQKNKETTVVMIRHAQSEWNRQNRFSGWANPELTEAGKQEAIAAGRRLAEAGFRFDTVHCSRLDRAQTTARLVVHHSRSEDAEMRTDWRLNERHYGALQGLNKAEMATKVGEEQVWRWRRSYLDQPPKMAANDPEHVAHQAQWRDVPADQVPIGESLAQTRQRVSEFWHEVIVPDMRAGKQILISSHGNTLRALLMELSDMSIDEVESFEIPTGIPILYRFDAKGSPLGWAYQESASQDSASQLSANWAA